MFRIIVLVAMILISQVPDGGNSLLPYKDYALALLLSLLIKPWLANQYR